MDVRVEDLAEAGLVLIPPSSPEFAPMLADIQSRLEHRIAGSPPPTPWNRPPWDDRASAIFVNRSDKPVLAWTLHWKCEMPDGRPRGAWYTSGTGLTPSLLLPFGLAEKTRRLYGYWHTILPGSKRFVANGQMFGDNTDVRPPEPDEMWRGGGIGLAQGSRERWNDALAATIEFDSVFFTDGEFVGKNSAGLWDEVVEAAKAYQEVMRIVRDAYGQPPADVFAAIERVTGPASGPKPPPSRPGSNPDYTRQWARHHLAERIAAARMYRGNDGALALLREWADVQLPDYRRR